MTQAASLRQLLGPIKARGLLEGKIQTILQRHCEQGRIAEVADVVSLALYHESIANGRMPAPRGVRTRELVERAVDGAKKLAEGYARHGVLCAKGFYPAHQVMLDLLSLWESEFKSVVLHPEEHGDLVLDGVDPDFISRSTIAAERLRRLLLRLSPSSDGQALLLPMKDMEGLCVAAVRNMYFSFTQADVAVHDIMHGALPKEEGEVLHAEEKNAFLVGWHRAKPSINARTRLLFQMHMEEGRAEMFATGWYLFKLLSLLFGEKVVEATER